MGDYESLRVSSLYIYQFISGLLHSFSRLTKDRKHLGAEALAGVQLECLCVCVQLPSHAMPHRHLSPIMQHRDTSVSNGA